MLKAVRFICEVGTMYRWARRNCDNRSFASCFLPFPSQLADKEAEQTSTASKVDEHQQTIEELRRALDVATARGEDLDSRLQSVQQLSARQLKEANLHASNLQRELVEAKVYGARFSPTFFRLGK